MADITPRIDIRIRSKDIARLLGVEIKIGMSAMGNQHACVKNQAVTAIALRRRTFSTSQIAGICRICIMNGSAANTPIWKLLAPNARAKAARKPLVVILNKAREVVPSNVNQRRPVDNSWSEIVGLGLKRRKICMHYKLE
jgi:hypothetical protein